MAIVYVWLLLSGLSYAHSFNCSFYDKKCTDNKISTDYGIDYCRKTVETCTEGYPGVRPENLYCYNLHEIDKNGGVGVLLKQGCQSNMESKCQRRRCVVHSLVRGNHLMCCCQGNMCNNESISLVKDSTSQSSHSTRQVTTEFTVELTTELPPSPKSHDLSSDSSISKNLIVIGLSTVGGVVVLATIFVVSFWCWSNRQKDAVLALEDKLDNAINRRNVEQSESASLFPNVSLTSLSLIEKIGNGRFSEVWKASLNDNLVAVKIFPKQEKQSWITERDMYMHPEIKHENLRSFLTSKCHIDESSMTYWMILDYHEMGSLSDYLKSNVLTLENVCKMAGSVAAGLAYLHSEITSENGEKPAIAHRDMKSRNILVKTDLTCCICDLGLCIKFQPGMSFTKAQGQVGTIRYMAPEVLEGAIMFNRESFLRIDIYALGLVMWEMISRCTVKGPVNEYKQPFEEEVGLHPNVKQMQDIVVSSRTRPKFPKGWNCLQPLESLVETVEECWDHDAEARLTAKCVEKRANLCLKVSSDLVHVTGVLEQTSNTDKSSPEPHHVSKGQLQGGQQTGDCNGNMTPLHNGCVPVPSQQTSNQWEDRAIGSE